MAEYCLIHDDYYELHVDHFIERPWTGRVPLRVGDVPRGLGTPDYYCCVERNGEPDFVIQVYGNGPSVFTGFTSKVVEATFWQAWLVAGSMTKVHFISLIEVGALFVLLSLSLLWLWVDYQEKSGQIGTQCLASVS